MPNALQFLIVDGYAKNSRDELEAAGMKLAWQLYAELLKAYLPDAGFDVLLPSDPGSELPTGAALQSYQGVIWTGCNLTIYDTKDKKVARQITLAREAYEKGVPSTGSCWGVQMAAVAAGGEVTPNPKGREMGIARKIHLTAEGRAHPYYEGKPSAFDGFISHVDEVTGVPPGGTVLATNNFTGVQALAIKYKQGEFWATQYHPEYDLHEMARLIVAREPKLTRESFFRDHAELESLVGHMERLFADPSRKDLRWLLGIDDDLLDDRIRQQEFANWIEKLVLPTAQGAKS